MVFLGVYKRRELAKIVWFEAGAHLCFFFIFLEKNNNVINIIGCCRLAASRSNAEDSSYD